MWGGLELHYRGARPHLFSSILHESGAPWFMTTTWAETALSDTTLGLCYVIFSQYQQSRGSSGLNSTGNETLLQQHTAHKSHTAATSCKGALNLQATWLVCVCVRARMPASIQSSKVVLCAHSHAETWVNKQRRPPGDMDVAVGLITTCTSFPC